MGSNPVDGQHIPLNGVIYVYGSILRFVVVSVVDAELGALFLNCKEGKVI